MKDLLQDTVLESDFLAKEALIEYDVYPVMSVLSGSRGYGLSGLNSDRDYVGIHYMNTWCCLDHPDFIPSLQVVRTKFDQNLVQIPDGQAGGTVSLDSFEMWKFISLFLKGSQVAYELVHMPAVYKRPEILKVRELMREGATTRFAKSCKGLVLHHARKDQYNRKKAVMYLYRLLQALHFLQKNEFQWDADTLFNYIPERHISTGWEIFNEYRDENLRTTKLKEDQLQPFFNELTFLIEELNKAIIGTKLPDSVPKSILDKILYEVKVIRSKMI